MTTRLNPGYPPPLSRITTPRACSKKIIRFSRDPTHQFKLNFKHGEKWCRLVVDSVCHTNAITENAVSRMLVTTEPHPHPYRLICPDESVVLVSRRCLVPFTIKAYSEHVWCDVLPMKDFHVLLGHPWLASHDIIYDDRDDTLDFMHQGRLISLRSTPPKKPTVSSGDTCSSTESTPPDIDTHGDFDTLSQNQPLVCVIPSGASTPSQTLGPDPISLSQPVDIIAPAELPTDELIFESEDSLISQPPHDSDSLREPSVGYPDVILEVEDTFDSGLNDSGTDVEIVEEVGLALSTPRTFDLGMSARDILVPFRGEAKRSNPFSVTSTRVSTFSALDPRLVLAPPLIPHPFVVTWVPPTSVPFLKYGMEPVTPAGRVEWFCWVILPMLADSAMHDHPRLCDHDTTHIRRASISEINLGDEVTNCWSPFSPTDPPHLRTIIDLSLYYDLSYVPRRLHSPRLDVTWLADPLGSIHSIFTAPHGASRLKLGSVLVDPYPGQLPLGNLESDVSSFGIVRRIFVMLETFATPSKIFVERGPNPIFSVSRCLSLFLEPLHLAFFSFPSTKNSYWLRGEMGSMSFTLMVISGGMMSIDVLALSPSFSNAMIKAFGLYFLLDRLTQVDISLGPRWAPFYFLPPWPDGPPSRPAPSDVLLQVAALLHRFLHPHSSVMSVFEWGRIDGGKDPPDGCDRVCDSTSTHYFDRGAKFEDYDGRCREISRLDRLCWSRHGSSWSIRGS